ncbi:MAG: GntR family transcriptional regulator [Pseudomonadota bacterium]
MADAKTREAGVKGSAKGKSNTQHAVSVLKSLILENRLSSGSNHLESELAEMLGMSRTPVREATLILEAQGLVEVKPRHGVRILSLSPEDMAEIYDILTELESLSAELAAGKDYVEADFATAEDAIRRMDEALANEDRETWAVADELFHSELVRLGGNRRIGNIFRTYSDQVRRARNLTLNLRPKPTKSNDDHRRVLKAIRDGDSERAREIHRAHRVQAKEMLIGILEQYGFHNV